jgi:AAA+ superfamily predicted ATPase
MVSIDAPATPDWYRANHRYLMAAIARVRHGLNRRIERQENPQQVGDPEPIALPELEAIEPPAALDRLAQLFDLSAFERDLLILCAGLEFDGSWGSLCARAQGDSHKIYPTFSLALAVLPEANWAALTPAAPLRRWRLVEIGAGHALTASPLRIDERILHYLAGIEQGEERLVGIAQELPSAGALVPSHQEIARQMAIAWMSASQEGRRLPILQLCGADSSTKRAIAVRTCEDLGLKLHAIAADALPNEMAQLNLIRCLCEREWLLGDRALTIECDRVDLQEWTKEGAIARFIEALDCPVILSSRDRFCGLNAPLMSFDIYPPSYDEQRVLWRTVLGETLPEPNGGIEHLISHFTLTSDGIQSAYLKARSLDRHSGEDDGDRGDRFQQQLWQVCRVQARPRLDELAQRIDSAATWDDLILPDKERKVLREIAAHVRQRAKVYETWGFASKSRRGLGIGALFAGASGTGKTMAAEVLAGELKLDVYRIDLSSVVSKYIGETEKNLRRVFDAAEGGGAILLFDEADALFGKRSEVKDSHDRHANIEVSYLLQRMEAYRGLAILTTNLKSSLDQAFLRRLRFVVQFPFPDSNQRAEIWQRIFPRETPTEGLDFGKLSRLSVAGGNIRNIALNAAFLAAEANEPVRMQHLLQAAKSEYTKMERPLTDVEVKGWV